MMTLTTDNWTCDLDPLVKAVAGDVISSPRRQFHCVGTDTRKPLEGKLFVALKGETHDAHEHVPQAVASGANVVMVHEWRETWKPLTDKASFVKVADTLHGLQNFARYWRSAHQFKVLAITGSNGKTSTKEFTSAILRGVMSTHASHGSYNNHWGVPLTILEAVPGTRALVVEMGMNKLGEIWRLCQIAEPDIVAVTTVGRAHIGELGSQTNVAQAKEEIYVASPKAMHVFNMDNEWTMRMQSRSHSTQVTFSAFRKDVDIHLRAQKLTWEGLDLLGHIQGVSGKALAKTFGRQNTVNLMCAAGLACAAGVSPQQIWHGLETLRASSWGRNQLVELENGTHVLFDAYNANPESVLALLKNLYEMEAPRRKFLVIGDMKELGTFTEKAHQEIGERAGAIPFECIWYIGTHHKTFLDGLKRSVGKNIPVLHSVDFDAKIADQLRKSFEPGDVVAVKGSRAMALERVVAGWKPVTPLGDKP